MFNKLNRTSMHWIKITFTVSNVFGEKLILAIIFKQLNFITILSKN